jgi:hypothetical protein
MYSDSDFPPWVLTQVDVEHIWLERTTKPKELDGLPHVEVREEKRDQFFWSFYWLVSCPECARVVTVDDLGAGACPGCGVA